MLVYVTYDIKNLNVMNKRNAKNDRLKGMCWYGCPNEGMYPVPIELSLCW